MIAVRAEHRLMLTLGVNAKDSLEWGAVRRGNGYVHGQANAHAFGAHGLRPEWNGAGCCHAIKHLCSGAAS